MARYNSTSLALAEETAAQDCFSEVEGYLSSEGGYWQTHDISFIGRRLLADT